MFDQISQLMIGSLGILSIFFIVKRDEDKRKIGMILGLSTAIIAVGQVAGPLVAGVFADWFGNYRVGFTVLALVAGAGSIFFAMARKPA